METLTLPTDSLKYKYNQVLSAYQEKIPPRNAVYAHTQGFSAGNKLLLAILKAFIPQPLTKQQTKVFHVL
jgi:hypothetical protein